MQTYHLVASTCMDVPLTHIVVVGGIWDGRESTSGISRTLFQYIFIDDSYERFSFWTPKGSIERQVKLTKTKQAFIIFLSINKNNIPFFLQTHPAPKPAFSPKMSLEPCNTACSSAEGAGEVS